MGRPAPGKPLFPVVRVAPGQRQSTINDMKHVLFSLLLAAALTGSAGASAPSAELRARLTLDPFYTRHLEAMGIPILSSDAVSEAARHEAAHLLTRMLDGRPDLAAAIVKNNIRLAIMAPTEFTTDVPEHRHLEPPEFWNRRARGLGATREAPAVSCGEENLLGLAGDPYATENILIHEFAHVIHQMGLVTLDPAFEQELETTYQAALAQGLWKGAYAATNAAEYWAEGVQSWFDTNRENDAYHNHVNTRDELKSYDPALAALIARELGDRPWRYRRPAERPEPERSHLLGFDPASAPAFRWPADAPAADPPR